MAHLEPGTVRGADGVGEIQLRVVVRGAADPAGAERGDVTADDVHAVAGGQDVRDVRDGKFRQGECREHGYCVGGRGLERVVCGSVGGVKQRKSKYILCLFP